MTSIAGLILGALAVILAWLPSTAGLLALANTPAIEYVLSVVLAPGGAVLLWPELFLIAAGLILSGIGYWEARRASSGTDLAIAGLVTHLVAVALILLRLLVWGIAALAQLV